MTLDTRTTALPEYPPCIDTSERDTYDTFLDYYRAVIARKLEGLSEDDARKAQTPSGMSVLGLVNHMAGVELWWFVEVLLGQAPNYPWTEADMDADPDVEWKPPASTTVADVLAFYQRACTEARAACVGKSLEDVIVMPTADNPKPDRTLRWIYVHMIEETARHAGHLDVLREHLDGVVYD